MERTDNDYLFFADTGKVYGCPGKSCLTCKHCTDVWLDYSNGPYMWFCELSLENPECDCERWEHNGSMTVSEYREYQNSSEYKQKLEEDRIAYETLQKSLKTLKEEGKAVEVFNKLFENTINSIAYKVYHTDSRKNLSNIARFLNKTKEDN